MANPGQPTLKSLLDFYTDAGVDESIAARPVDWFAAAAQRATAPPQSPRPPTRKQSTRATPSPAVTPAAAATSPDEAFIGARERAAKAQSLAELEEQLRDFEGCPLKKTAKNTCFKRGSDTARIMFIGEGPGRDEDLQGLPFVGRAGKLLDKMLAAIGLGEDDVYITNIVYWRPPGNRTPTAQEVQACAPFLERQIELLDPGMLILIGGPAAHNILNTTVGITKLRGQWREVEIGGKTRHAMPILHPAYLLRTPASKGKAWRDMLEIEKALNNNDGQLT